MSYDEHLWALVFFHLSEHKSTQHLLQILEEDDFARGQIAPKGGSIPRKIFFTEGNGAERPFVNQSRYFPDVSGYKCC